MAFDFEAETYSKTGNIAADGIQRLLGNPNMDRLETVLRESVQNSWDAADREQTPECHLAIREFTADQMETLRHGVFGDIDTRRKPLDSLMAALANDGPLLALQIADFGTSGLGGATDPSMPPKPGESTDFVDFLRNIGTPRDTMFGGGTYGYGKSSLYVASGCGTILVDSVTEFQGRPERRLMACNISSLYDVAGGDAAGRYTGRHWWGMRDSEGVLRPVTGERASQIAESLGFPARSMKNPGTTVAILAPDLPESSKKDELAPVLVGSLLANFWPKMVPREEGGDSPMRFRLHVLGRDVQIPHPADVPPLERFVDALNRARANMDQKIRSQRPNKLLGNLSCRPGLKLTRRSDIQWPASAPFADQSHHIALMRPAELVVEYLPGGVLPNRGLEWGGVFIVNNQDHDVEHAFALSEPPAHDDWVPSSMEKGSKKTMVNVGLRRIREAIGRIGETGPPANKSGDGAPLAGISNRLGGALLGGPGQRLGGGGSGGGGSTGRTGVRRGRIDVEFDTFRQWEGTPCSQYLVACGRTDEGFVLRGISEVLLDDRKAVQEAPNGARPKVVAWFDEAGMQVGSGDSLQVPAEGGQFAVMVTMPDLVAVRLRLVRDGH